MTRGVSCQPFISALFVLAVLCEGAAFGQDIQLGPAVMLDTVIGHTLGQPSIIVDSSGILIYAIRQTTTDTELVGFKIADPTHPESCVPLGSVIPDAMVFDAWLTKAGNHNVLLWKTDRSVGATTTPSVDSVYFLETIFQSSVPTTDELAQSILLGKWQTSDRTVWPWDVRSAILDSLLYLEYTTGSDWFETIRDIHSVVVTNLVTKQKENFRLPRANTYPSAHTSGGRSEFITTAQGISIVDPDLFCHLYFYMDMEPWCFRPEVYYRTHSIALDSVNDSGVVIDSVYLADDATWYDVRHVTTDSGQFFALRGAREIRKLNTQTDGFEFVASVPAARSENLLPVTLQNGFAILATTRSHTGDHLELYDRSWSHLTSDNITYAGESVQNVWIAAMPSSSSFAVCYTAVAPEPYNQRRLFVQTGTAAIPTDVTNDDPEPLPSDFSLSQNYPNPFNSQSVISFSLPQKERVSLRIYNSLGQLV